MTYPHEPRVLDKVEAFFRTQTPSAWNTWEVLSMRVEEHLGKPYEGRLEIATEDQKVDFSKLLGRSCVLDLRRGANVRRSFKGMIFRVEHLGIQCDHALARIDFAAALKALHYGRDTRIFEDQTVPEIIKEVVTSPLQHLRREVRFDLKRTYPKREYCVQWQESDLKFVQRLMVEEGIFHYFLQGKKDETETVVFVDDNHSLPRIETMPDWDALVRAARAQPIPVVPVTEHKSFFKVRFVDHPTGEPAAGVMLDIKPSNGVGKSHRLTTGSDGIINIPGVDAFGCHNISCPRGGAQRTSSVEFVGTGEATGASSGNGANGADGGSTSDNAASKGPGKTTKREPAAPAGAAGSAAKDGTNQGPLRVVEVERYKVKRGDTLQKIAGKYDLTPAMLATFNWGVYSPQEIEQKLRDEVGCTEKDANGRYVLSDEDKPGVILIPKEWRVENLEAGKMHTIRVRRIEWTSARHSFRISLEIDPDNARNRNDRFTLFSEDEDFRQTLTMKDDLIPGNRRVDLEFTGLPSGVAYSLQIDPGDGNDTYLFFDLIPFEDIAASREPDLTEDGITKQTQEPDTSEALQ